MQRGAQMPVWLGAITALLAVILTIFADRIALASQVTRAEGRIETLEAQHVAMVLSDEKLAAADEKIIVAVGGVQTSINSQTLLLQKVIDRQNEVRRILRLWEPDEQRVK